MLSIVHAPNPVLSQEAKKVEKVDKTVLSLVEEMKTALLNAKDPQGVGLAAPQVGKSLRIFIVKATPQSPISVFINPEILEMEKDSIQKGKKRQSTKLEGCLSLPNIWGTVKRSSMVRIAYTDEKGKPHERKVMGFMATIMQHEVDHLHGVLFPKRVLEQKGKLYRSHKNEKGEDGFDPIEL